MTLSPSDHWETWLCELNMHGQQGGFTYPPIDHQGFS